MNKLLIVAMAVLLGACARDTLRPDYGYSYQQNTQVQTLNPGAGFQDYGLINPHGPKLEAGYERYLKDDGRVDDERVVDEISD